MIKGEFGISKTMNGMLVSDWDETRTVGNETEVYNNGFPCPLFCDARSL